MLTGSQKLVVDVVSVVSSSLSVVGAGFIIASYVLLRRFQSEARRCLAFLSVADMLLSLSSLVLIFPSHNSRWACRTYTLTSTYFNGASFLWTMWTSYVIYKQVHSPAWSIRGRGGPLLMQSAWAVPVLSVVAITLSPHSSDQQDIGCWIAKRPLRNTMLRLFTTYIPLWIAWIFNAVMYARTIAVGRWLVQQEQLRLLDSDRQTSQDDRAMKSPVLQGRVDVDVRALDRQFSRLQLIPIAFVLLRLPGTVNVIKDLVNPDLHFFVVDVLEAAGDQLQAAVHAVLFVLLHPGVRAGFREWWATRHEPDSTAESASTSVASRAANFRLSRRLSESSWWR